MRSNLLKMYNNFKTFVFRPNCVTVNLHPSTGSDDHKSKYVCLNLSLAIPDKYPRIPPVISIKNPRGLSEAHVVRFG